MREIVLSSSTGLLTQGPLLFLLPVAQPSKWLRVFIIQGAIPALNFSVGLLAIHSSIHHYLLFRIPLESNYSKIK